MFFFLYRCSNIKQEPKEEPNLYQYQYISPQDTSSSDRRRDNQNQSPHLPAKEICIKHGLITNTTKCNDQSDSDSIENDGYLINMHKNKTKKKNKDKNKNEKKIYPFERWKTDKSMYENNKDERIYDGDITKYIVEWDDFQEKPFEGEPGPGKWKDPVTLNPYHPNATVALWHSQTKLDDEEKNKANKQIAVVINAIKQYMDQFRFSNIISENSTNLQCRKFLIFHPQISASEHRRIWNQSFCPPQSMNTNLSFSIFIN